MAPFQVPSKLFSNLLFEIISSFIQINLRPLESFVFSSPNSILLYFPFFYVAFAFKKAPDKSNRQQKSSG